MGVDSPAAEAVIEAMLTAEEPDEFRGGGTGARPGADWRGVTWCRCGTRRSRIAYKAGLAFPEQLPLYGDWTGWLPDVWWRER